MNNTSPSSQTQEETFFENEINERILELEQCYETKKKEQLNSVPTGFILDESNLWFKELTDDDDKNEPAFRICSRLEITAVTRDQNSENFGRLLEFHDCDGKKHLWCMPMSMLAGDGQPYRSELLSQGLEIEPGKKCTPKTNQIHTVFEA